MTRRTRPRGPTTRAFLSEEHRALAALFQVLAQSFAAASVVAGCSTSSAPQSTALDASADATSDAGDPSLVDSTDPASETDEASATDEVSVDDAGDEVEVATDDGLDWYDPGLLDACAPTISETGTDASALCSRYYDLPCALPPDIVSTGGCRIAVADCVKLCHYDAINCTIVGAGCIDDTYVSIVGPITVYCDVCGAGGRRPEGLGRLDAPRAASGAGLYFASMAALEAASVPAFRRLARALHGFGAPRALVVAASRAARDEIRHARAATRLARRFGAHPRAPRVAEAPRRSLEALARENEVEGCVREAFAALVVTVQARRATDAAVAQALRTIATDETRHAALSFAIASWARATLSRAANARLDRARDRAFEALASELASPSPGVAALAGVPSAVEQRALLRAMRASLSQSPKPTTDRTQSAPSPSPAGRFVPRR